MSPSTLRLKPVAVTMTSASSSWPDLQPDALRLEALDLVGDHRGLALAHALEQVGIGHEGDALLPGPVARVEVLVDLGLVARAERGAHAGQQFLAHHLGLGHAAPGERGLVEQHLAAHDLVRPLVRDLQLAQHVGQLVGIAPGDEEGGRALQHGDVRALLGDRRDQRRRGRARADDHHLLAVQRQVLGPGLRVHDAALEALHARPLRRVALGMAVVALAHPQELRGEAHRLQRWPSCALRLGLDQPAALRARPLRRADGMAVADVRRQTVVVDHLAQVLQDLLRGGDGLAHPGLEAVAEGEQVAVGADARVAVRAPGAAVAGLRLQDQRSACPGIAAAGGRRRRRRRCRRRRSARRSLRWCPWRHSNSGSCHHGKNSGMSADTLSG